MKKQSNPLPPEGAIKPDPPPAPPRKTTVSCFSVQNLTDVEQRKTSDIILDSHILENSTRGDALEKLVDLVFEYYGSDPNQISNGDTIDCILRLFDQAIPKNSQAQTSLISCIDSMKEQGP